MRLLKKHAATILISLLVGILLIFLQDPLKYLGSTLLQTLISISNRFSNYYYKLIALNDPSSFLQWNSFLLFIIFAFCVFAMLTYLRDANRKYKSKNKNILSEIESTKAKIQPSEKEIGKNIDDIRKELKLLEESANQMNNRLAKNDKLILKISLIFSILLLSIFLNNTLLTSVSEENIIFRNDLIKIGPFSNDIEIKMIQAKWTMMKNNTDYDSVKHRLSEIKKINKIE